MIDAETLHRAVRESTLRLFNLSPGRFCDPLQVQLILDRFHSLTDLHLIIFKFDSGTHDFLDIGSSPDHPLIPRFKSSLRDTICRNTAATDPAGLTLSMNGRPVLLAYEPVSQGDIYTHRGWLAYHSSIEPLPVYAQPAVSLFAGILLDFHFRDVESLSFENRRMSHLDLIYELSGLLMQTHDLRHRLFMIMTAVTLLEGLGFNRAALYLLSEDGEVLKGALGIGPDNLEQAHRIWMEIQRSGRPAREWLAEIITHEKTPSDPLHFRLIDQEIPLADHGHLVKCFLESTPQIVPEDELLSRSIHDRYLFDTDAFGCVPVISGNTTLGVIAVDNRFSRHPITHQCIRYLQFIAGIAASSLENAQSFAQIVHLNKQLRETRRALFEAEKLTAVGELTMQLAHEIRNPLTAIGGYARLIMQNAPAPQSDRQFAETIYRETIRLEQILNDTLTFGRTPAGDLTSLDLHLVLHEVLDVLAVSFHEAEIRIESRFDGRHLWIQGDDLRLKQALHNLFRNSIQVQPEGGCIRLHTFRDLNHGYLAISDDGPTITLKNMKKIFEPFYSRSPGGSGLGLHIARKMLECMYSDISVERSSAGRLVFTLSFQLTADHGEQAP